MVARIMIEVAEEVVREIAAADLVIVAADLVIAAAGLVIAAAGLEIEALLVIIAASHDQDLEAVVTANREVAPEIEPIQ